MSYRSTKAFSEKFSTELTSSNEAVVHKDDLFHSQKLHRKDDYSRITESKSSTNLAEAQHNLDPCEIINQKISRNRKIIEELKKGPEERSKDFLKNLNVCRSPTYLELDREK